jgi:hypothetical protein
MDTTTYLIHIALIAIVIKQVHEHRVDLQSLLLPVALVGFAGWHYLTDVPTGGNDVLFDAILIAVGVGLGTVCGVFTQMRVGSDGSVLAKAGLIAAGAWCIGLATRLGIAVASDHGLGPSLAHFSATNHITGENAWTAAFVLMALVQVLVRLSIIQGRRVLLERRAASEGSLVAA